MQMAERDLGRQRALWPFGAVVGLDGTISPLFAAPAEGTEPDTALALRTLYVAAGAQAAERRAVAFVSDVFVGGQDAVRVELEHVEGVAIAVLTTYQRSRLRRTVSWLDLETREAEPRIWPRR
jgi:hypothetical protein